MEGKEIFADVASRAEAIALDRGHDAAIRVLAALMARVAEQLAHEAA